MDVQNQVQLACLLDKLSELYRGGIPNSAIVTASPAGVDGKISQVRLRLVVSGEMGSLSQAELSLLDAIATSGLRLTAGEYTKEILGDGEDPFSAQSQHAPVTILFGCGDLTSDGPGVVINAAPLSQLVADANSKKLLWRELQQRWPKSA